jgi:hypothetical protein
VSSASGRKGTNPRVRAPLVRSVQCGRARWGCCCSASCRCMHEHGARRRAGVPGVPLSLRREDQPARGHWTSPSASQAAFWLACLCGRGSRGRTLVETPWLFLVRQEAKTIEHQQMRAVWFSVKNKMDSLLTSFTGKAALIGCFVRPVN